MTRLLLFGVLAIFGCRTTDFDVSNKQPVNVKEVEVFTQAEYPIKAFSVSTDDGRSAAIEEFKQSVIPLDILIVIDNSGSMAQEQQGLADKLRPLLSEVSDSDWRINIINTDADDPQCSRALVMKGDPLAEAKFKAGIEAGTNGSRLERGFLRAVQGIECNNDWVRPDSVLAVLIVSDEDNCSLANGNYGCEDNIQELNGQILINKLASIRKIGETARTYGILFGTEDNIEDCQGNNNVAAQYYEPVIELTKGVSASICSNDYTETLESISADLSGLLRNRFQLANTPNEGSLKVRIDDEDYEDFILEGNTLTLSERLDQGQQVSIEYLFGTQTGLSQISLPSVPVAESLQVVVDGELMQGAQLYLKDNNSVKFPETLLGQHEITVFYKENSSLTNQFQLTYREFKNVVVTVGGAKVEFSADPVNGFILLKDTPPPGSEVVIEYEFSRM